MGGGGHRTFTVKVTDADGVSATKSLTITVNPAPSISTTTLNTATEGQVGYSSTVAATGGTGAYTWSISSGTLPSGLTIGASTGIISGTWERSAISQTFTVRVTDANGVAATKSLTLKVNAAPSISPASLPNVTAGGTYPTQNLSVTGGTGPRHLVHFGRVAAVVADPNPSTGQLTSTAENGPGPFTFTVQATDTNGVSATRAYTITVNAAPSISPYEPAPGDRRRLLPGPDALRRPAAPGPLLVHFGRDVAVVAEPRTFHRPLERYRCRERPGPFTFTVQVTDSDGVTATQAYTITVNAALSITTTTLNTATHGQVGYSSTVAATGGTAAYTWATFGTLPSGLSINATTGVISGSVGAGATTLTFTVQVTDADGVVLRPNRSPSR